MKSFAKGLGILSTMLLSCNIAFADQQGQQACVNDLNGHVYEKGLDLYDCNLKDNDISKVAVYLKSHQDINSIYLERNHLTGKTLGELALPQVEEISLDHNKINDEGALIIAKSFKKASLKLLSLGHNDIGDTGAISLINIPSLKGIALSRNFITDETAYVIGKTARLVYVDLSKTDVTSSGVKALAKDTNLEMLGLQKLYLKDNHIQVLSDLKKLKVLLLANNSITAKGAVQLAGLQELLGLELSNNRIANEGALAVAGLPKLVGLALDNTGIDSTSMEKISQLNHLSFLTVRANYIDDNGAIALAKHHFFFLDISHNKLTHVGIEALNKSADILITNGNEQDLSVKASSNEESFFKFVKKLTHRSTH